MDVDDQYIDVQFDDQTEFGTGLIAETEFETFSTYEDTVPELSWNEIDAAIDKMDEDEESGAPSSLEWLIKRIFDQGREGSCVANACAQANQIIQAKQFGIDRVIDLAAISLYDQIGRSAQSGAKVSDGLNVMGSKGILPLDTPENRARFGDHVKPNTGFGKRYPDNWEDTASLFAGAEWYSCRTLKGLYTAGVNRDPIIVGREGHSICYARPKRQGAKRSMVYPNSWSLKWGIPMGNMTGGFGVDTAGQTEKSANYCFVLRSVKSPNLRAN